MAYLRAYIYREGTQELQLSEERIVIGRSVKKADLIISEQRVSRTHATIIFKEGHYILRDEQSTLGTYINQNRVKKALLADKDIIQIGESTLEFHDEASPQGDTVPGINPHHALDPHIQECLRQFFLLPDAVRMHYRVLQSSPVAFLSKGAPPRLSSRGILLPTYSPLRESTMVEMRLTTPDKKKTSVLGEVHAVIPYKNMQTMCIKLHSHNPEEYEKMIQTISRGVWIDGWPLGNDNTITDFSAL